IVRRYHIVLPSTLAMLLKMFVMLEGTSRTLSPNFNLAELIEPYQLKVLKHRLSIDRVLRRLYRAYRDWDRLNDILPRDVVEVLRRLRNGSFEMRHQFPKLETTIHRLTLGILNAALFLGSALIFSRQPDFSVGWTIGAIGTVLSMVLAFRLL